MGWLRVCPDASGEAVSDPDPDVTFELDVNILHVKDAVLTTQQVMGKHLEDHVIIPRESFEKWVVLIAKVMNINMNGLSMTDVLGNISKEFIE